MSDGPAVELIKYDSACRALAEAKQVDEVKRIRNVSLAMRTYARQAQNRSLEADAVEIRMRATRRLDQIRQEQKATVGLSAGSRGSKVKGARVDQKPTLAEAGIGKHLAHEGRKLGALSDKAFEKAVTIARESVGRIVKEALRTDDKKSRRAEREHELAGKILALPQEKFGIIVEDFEWDHKSWSEAGKDRHASNHYSTSSDAHTAAEIVERTKERFLCAADDCILFMWTTAPHLAIAIDVLRLRGFDYNYKSNDTWIKDKLGTGYWSQNQHETLLIGTRGKTVAPAHGSDFGSSVIVAPRGQQHSAKPEIVLEKIEELWPNTPKIELNRRGPPRPGWDAWGNEVSAPIESPPALMEQPAPHADLIQAPIG